MKTWLDLVRGCRRWRSKTPKATKSSKSKVVLQDFTFYVEQYCQYCLLYPVWGEGLTRRRQTGVRGSIKDLLLWKKKYVTCVQNCDWIWQEFIPCWNVGTLNLSRGWQINNRSSPVLTFKQTRIQAQYCVCIIEDFNKQFVFFWGERGRSLSPATVQTSSNIIGCVYWEHTVRFLPRLNPILIESQCSEAY